MLVVWNRIYTGREMEERDIPETVCGSWRSGSSSMELKEIRAIAANERF